MDITLGRRMRETADRLAYTNSIRHEVGIVEAHIRRLAQPAEPLRILEAGYASRWDRSLEDPQYADVERDDTPTDAHPDGDLHTLIDGDPSAVDLPAGHYDVVNCSHVLEHVAEARAMLENFVRWTRPGGLIVIKFLDPQSARGFVVRITPQWLRLLGYRWGLRHGTARHHPPPQRFIPASVLSRSGIRQFCSRHGLALVAEYGDGYRNHRRPRLLSRLFQRLLAALSFGILDAEHTNLLYILRKP